MKKQYKLLSFDDTFITYKSEKEQIETIRYHDFFIQNLWLHLDNEDKKALATFVKSNQGPDTLVETSTIPWFGVSFNTLYDYKFLPLLVGLMAFSLLAMILTGPHWIKLFGLTIGGGILIAPVGYLFLDTINEVFGYKQARLAVYFSVALLLFMALLLQFSFSFTPATHNALHVNPYSYTDVFQSVPRNLLCTSLALLIADTVNVLIFQVLKDVMRAKHLWFRAFISNVISQQLLLLLYHMLFYGSLMPAFFTINALIKVAVTIILIPVLYITVSFFRNFHTIWAYTGPNKCQPDKSAP